MSEEAALLPPGATTPGRIEIFRGAQGRELRYRVVEAQNPVHHVLYCHGIESHGTWFLPVAERLAALGGKVYLVDRRGSGLNRNIDKGHADNARCLLEDLRAFRKSIGDPGLHLVGLSWGGKLATAAAIDRREGVRTLSLITPGLVAKVDLSFRAKLNLLGGLLRGGRNLLSLPIEPEMFTQTPKYLNFIRNDPWRLHAVTARFLWSGVALDRLIRRELDTLNLPVLLILAGGERIVDNDGIRRLLARVPSGQLHEAFYEQATHSVQFEEVDRLTKDLWSHFERSRRAA